MSYRAKFTFVFGAGFVVGALFAATVVSWKWSRDFENAQVIGLAGQAHTVAEIYAGRSDELAERILAGLPINLADMDRNYSVTVSTPLVRNWVEAAYRESGQPMPAATRGVLDAQTESNDGS